MAVEVAGRGPFCGSGCLALHHAVQCRNRVLEHPPEMIEAVLCRQAARSFTFKLYRAGKVATMLSPGTYCGGGWRS